MQSELTMNAIRAALGKVVFIMAIVTTCPATVLAQGDEIQVYDGGLADPGVFNLTWHNNYTFSGARTAEFPGAYAANHALNGVTEWAYGVNNWWEVGLYLPLYTVSESSTRMNGFKLRTLFATPNAGDRTFFYGLGIELSDNAKSWDQTRITSEFRPIVGWHLGKVDVVFNPIIDTAYDGLDKLVFAPSTRIAYNASKEWAFAMEEYADFGLLNHFSKGSDQSHQLFGVVDYAGKSFEVQAGLGFGLTQASDNTVFKLIVAHDFN